MKTIVTPCYNEEENVERLYSRVRDVMAALGCFRYEHIFIDNCSTDSTMRALKRIAEADAHVRIIANVQNLGRVRSSHHALLEVTGDAVVGIATDMEDPAEIFSTRGSVPREPPAGSAPMAGEVQEEVECLS